MPAFTHNLNIIARCTQMQRSQRFKSLGVCGGQVHYLLRLSRTPGLTQEELARALYVNKSTAARQIAGLEKAGFVERRPDTHDRRCIRLYPSERALAALPEIRAVLGEWNDYLLAGLSEEEQQHLLSLLNRISGRARAYIEREEGWNP